MNQFLPFPSKIKLISSGKNFNKDPQPDFELVYKKGKVIFLNTEIKNLSFGEFEYISDKKRWFSHQGFSKLFYSKKIQDNLINNFFYYNESYISINTENKIYQKTALNKILKLMLSKKNLSNYYNNYLKTMKILEKINKLNENKK